MAMKYDLKKIKKSLSDELFLGFYKKGSFKSSDYTKEEFEIYLKILKEMSLVKQPTAKAMGFLTSIEFNSIDNC